MSPFGESKPMILDPIILFGGSPPCLLPSTPSAECFQAQSPPRNTNSATKQARPETPGKGGTTPESCDARPALPAGPSRLASTISLPDPSPILADSEPLSAKQAQIEPVSNNQTRDSQPHSFHGENSMIFAGLADPFQARSTPRLARLAQNTRQTENPFYKRG